METLKRTTRTTSIGDAAVEGLMYGILAGIVMAVLVLVLELAGGNPPLTVLGYFDAGGSGSPFSGLFTHIAVSGIYGVVFSILALILARIFGARITMPLWLVLGVVYALVIFGIAEAVLLPRTSSPLREIPLWIFGIAHIVYGADLVWLLRRNHR